MTDDAMVDHPETLPSRGRRRATPGRATPSSGVSAPETSEIAGLPDGARHVVDRLRRIEGQVRGLQRMVIAGEDCESILTQVMAARAALDRVAGQVVLENLEACFAARSPAAARHKAARTIQLLARNA
jgi:DNA-binding FrmR family transcriptional regulator